MRLEPAEVKAIRRRLEMSQAKLAEAMGVHERTVRQWEIKIGASGPTAIALSRLTQTNEEDEHDKEETQLP